MHNKELYKDISSPFNFHAIYLCEAAFSSMLVIKTKARNRLDVEPDLRCCLAVTQPRIQKLVN